MSDPLQRLAADQRKKARKISMPSWRSPMLATLTHEPFSDEGWIYERKLDGERALAWVEPSGAVRLMSRNRNEINGSYPEIEAALRESAPRGCILDGEIVAFDSHGVTDFQRLQPRMHASGGKDSRRGRIKVHYYVFDCLYAGGHDITACALRSRKKVLKGAMEWGGPVRWTPHRNRQGGEYLREACRKGWEGLIAKDAGSSYTHSRSRSWLKFKCVMSQELVIGGYTDPRGEREGLGALLLGFYRDGDLIYAGKVGTGFDEDALRRLRRRLEGLRRESSPFDRGDPDTRKARFVRPKLVCEVAFTGWTGEERLRHPRYKGLRRDKKAADVRKEEGRPRAEG